MFNGKCSDINPYDRCVANKKNEGAQCTISWYADDKNLSQKKSALILNIIKEIKKHYGHLSVVREKRHLPRDEH